MDKEPDSILAVKIAKLEERFDRARSEIDALRTSLTTLDAYMNDIADKLDDLNITIGRGVWLVFGAVALFVVQQIGFVEFIKQVL